jgi:phosphoglycolate phosphatase
MSGDYAIGKKRVDSIIFDLDGTLWDSTKEAAIAFNMALKEKHPKVKDEVTSEKLQALFGLPLNKIGILLFQSIPKEMAIKVIDDCCVYECEYLAKHGARLYEGLEDTLRELSKESRLFIVSNCQEGYIQCFFEAYPKLSKYFTDYEYPGRTNKLKADNIRLIMERNNLSNPVYVGDTQADADASKDAGVPFIFASYGFGDVKEYCDVINSISELKAKMNYKL